jgi:hypothetical protein
MSIARKCPVSTLGGVLQGGPFPPDGLLSRSLDRAERISLTGEGVFPTVTAVAPPGSILTLLATVAIAASCTSADPPPIRPIASVDPRSSPAPASRERLVAKYCVDAVDAIDSLAFHDRKGLEESLERLEEDAALLPSNIRREEAHLSKLLKRPGGPEELNQPSRAVWRMTQTPLRCLDIGGVLGHVPFEEQAVSPVPHPRHRASSVWSATTGNQWAGTTTGAPHADRARFYLSSVEGTSAECATYVLDTSVGRAVFTSECENWDPSFNFFLVDVRRLIGGTEHVRLTDFAILDRSGAGLTPVDVRSQATNPDVFVAPEQSVRTAKELYKFIVFDHDDLHPVAIAYESGQTLLIQVIRGKENLVKPTA